MKTEPVKVLMEEVLSSLPVPHGEDVIDDVFLAIEDHSEWLQRYDDLCHEFTKHVVNTMGGHWVAQAVGQVGQRQVTAKSDLIGSYSKLR